MEEAMSEQVGTKDEDMKEVPIKVEVAMVKEVIKETVMMNKDMEEDLITIHLSLKQWLDSIIQQVVDVPVLIVALVSGLFAVLTIFLIAACTDMIMISTYYSRLVDSINS